MQLKHARAIKPGDHVKVTGFAQPLVIADVIEIEVHPRGVYRLDFKVRNFPKIITHRQIEAILDAPHLS